MIRHQCPECKSDIDYTEKYDEKTHKLTGKQAVYFPIKDRQGNWNWKNLFKMRTFTLIIIFLLLFLSWAYQKDVENCHNITGDICGACKRAGCYSRLILSNTQGEKQVIDYNAIEIP